MNTSRPLAALLGTAAVAHAVAPRFFDAIVPAGLPGTRRFWTYASGVAEGAVAAAVAVPPTRRPGGYAAAALFVAVFPANLKTALDRADEPARRRAVAHGRLPLQVPLALWVLRVARRG
ncbi:DoxX family protein [Pseudonocardia yuanmonensis]|uniref:DoxX family protein n=1 Tax=Pseudonocardia yuanmonensis TaxID=1095914 RepID=A0ABP8WI43_9PSEU